MWEKLLRWVPTIVSNAPRVIDAVKAAWAAFRHAPAPDAPSEQDHSPRTTDHG